jgi:pimeloyl-ACP methyl ester carboxylesterase
MSETFFKNRKVHYTSSGNGPAVVLLHGFLEDLTMWDEFEREFSKKNRVVRIDLLGHGLTENQGDVHSMEDQAEMVKNVLDELEIDRYVVIGHSMGGYIALALAELYPEDLTGLVLMNSTSLPDSDEKKHNRDRAVEAVKNNHKSFVRIAIPGLFAPENRKRLAKKIKEVTEVALRPAPEGIIAALKGMKIRKNRSAVFKNGKYPKLMIVGKQDPALDLQTLIPQTKFPGVETVTFDDGHMSHIENQNELERNLLQFLERISN